MTSTATSNASNQLKGDIIDDLKRSANSEKLLVKPNIPERPKEGDLYGDLFLILLLNIWVIK